MEGKYLLNDVKNRFLFICPSVQAGLEAEAKITDFDMLNLLGEGSFGKVYLCKHKVTGGVYAIKSIDKTNKNNDSGKPYFRREVEIMYKLNHPNIVKLFGHFEDSQNCYFIMEYIPKGNLFSLLSRQKSKCFETAKVAAFMKDLISAVYFIHNMDPPIVHRDIKPENILIADDGKLKLTDFGWSNYIEYFHIRSTFCGTPLYLAPEVIKQTGHDKSVDVWCIGALIFELLTGNCPFNGMTDSILYDHILKNKIDWPKDINLEAKDLISKILRTEPKDRLSLNDMLKHPFFTKNVDNPEEFLYKPSELNTLDQKNIFVVSKDSPQTAIVKNLAKKSDLIAKDLGNLNINQNLINNITTTNYNIVTTNYTYDNQNNIIIAGKGPSSDGVTNNITNASDNLLSEFKKVQNQNLEAQKKIDSLIKENEELKLKSRVFSLEKESLIKEKEEQENEKLKLQMEFSQLKYKLFEYEAKANSFITVIKQNEQAIDKDKNTIILLNTEIANLKKSKDETTSFYVQKIEHLEQSLREANSKKQEQIESDITYFRQSLKGYYEKKPHNYNNTDENTLQQKYPNNFPSQNQFDFNFLNTIEMLQKDFEEERKKYNLIIQNKQDEISRFKNEINYLKTYESQTRKSIQDKYLQDIANKENEIAFLNTKIRTLEDFFKNNLNFNKK